MCLNAGVCVCFVDLRASQSSRVSSEETQDQPKAPDPVQHVSAARAGEEVPAETVPVHRRAGRVLQLTQLDGDSGEDLVSEQTS